MTSRRPLTPCDALSTSTRIRFKAWNNLGIVLVLGGDPAAAEAAWRQSLAIRPDFPDARLNLAKLLDARARATPGAAGVDDAAFGHEDDPAPP